MRVEFLVEEPSIEAALENLLPKMLDPQIETAIHNFHDKLNLLAKLPTRLKGYSKWLPGDWRIVVLIDEDRQDCEKLKSQLEKAASDARLITKSAAPDDSRFQVLNRIVIEELEAWFFGDVEALVKAYPRVPATLAEKRGYGNPDAITGGTWEVLERVLQRVGYYPGGLPKIEVARNISQHMEPSRNRSKSFNHFMTGLQALVEE